MPYTKGRKFDMFRHIPPPPLGRPYPNCRTITPRETLRHLTQFEYCLSASPLGGITNNQEASSFTVVEELALRDGRGAQIVLVDNGLVAKIYDPLYYPSYHEDTPIRADVVEWAERHYSREAAAYEELDSRFGGIIIPKYHGSWAFDVAVDTASGIIERPVRLILMEFIEGITMLKLDPDQLSEEQKANIMVKAIEAEVALSHHGVVQGDFAPRNVLCSGNDLKSAKLRVVLIDFNASRILRLVGVPPNPSKLPISPIVRYWAGAYQFDAAWLPHPPGEWLWKHWGDSPFYQPVIRGEERQRLQPPPSQAR
jgi:serine/threonine protein kinase